MPGKGKMANVIELVKSDGGRKRGERSKHFLSQRDLILRMMEKKSNFRGRGRRKKGKKGILEAHSTNYLISQREGGKKTSWPVWLNERGKEEKKKRKDSRRNREPLSRP